MPNPFVEQEAHRNPFSYGQERYALENPYPMRSFREEFDKGLANVTDYVGNLLFNPKAVGYRDLMDAFAAADKNPATVEAAKALIQLTPPGAAYAASKRLMERGLPENMKESVEAVTDLVDVTPPGVLESIVAKTALKAPLLAVLMTAWHGSPTRGIKKMSNKFIGSGEGSAAYGYGWYAADLKDVAETYRKSRNAAPKMPEVPKKAQKSGSLYKVDIPEETSLLDWDRPWNEQPEKVKNALKKALGDQYDEATSAYSIVQDKNGKWGIRFKSGSWDIVTYGTKEEALQRSLQLPEHEKKSTGGQVYKWLEENMPRKAELSSHVEKLIDGGMSPGARSDEIASRFLHSIGIPGHRYLDQGSRAAGKGTHNYVIYDDEAIKILEELSKAKGQQRTFA
jgi:hypothetical protein